MARTYDDGTIFDQVAPGLASSSVKSIMLDLAEDLIGEGAPFDDKTDRAHALMAAHMTALHPASEGLAGAGVAAGNVTSMAEGGASVSFAAPATGYASSAGLAWLNLTSYGQILAAMVRKRGPALRMAVARPDWVPHR